jgi:uncharacterized protein YceH (UPF0502 family)
MLSIVQGRILGSLLEKERTTPDQYPLSLNALVTACNQSTSREPVMALADHEVESALTSMKSAGMVRMVHPSHGRSVTRYRQVYNELHSLEPSTCSVLAVLLLRGPQTAAELRTRTERLHAFASLTDVENCLSDAAAAGLVQLLERLPGHKEPRWKQLIAEEAEFVPSAARSSESSSAGLAQRVAELEERVQRLESALADLL